MAEAAKVRENLASNPIWQAEAAGPGGDPAALQALRRKSELAGEAAALRRRMKESQLTRWVA